MSITVTCEFSDLGKALGAASRLRRRGFLVTGPGHQEPGRSLMLVQPVSARDTPGNQVLSGLPVTSGNALVTEPPAPRLKVLTDDTRAAYARDLLQALGGHLIS